MTNVSELVLYNKYKDSADTVIAVIDLNMPHLRNRIFTVIQQKQNGKWHHCKRNITVSDTVVSDGKGRGYYHKSERSKKSAPPNPALRSFAKYTILRGVSQLLHCVMTMLRYSV